MVWVLIHGSFCSMILDAGDSCFQAYEPTSEVTYQITTGDDMEQRFSRCFLYVSVGWNTTEFDAEKKMNPSKFIQLIVGLIALLKMQHDAPKSLDKSNIHGSDKLRSCVQSWKIHASSRYDLVRNGCSCSGNTTKGQNFDVDRNLVKDGNR